MSDMMTLVEPLIPSLRRYARTMTQDRAVADDLVQDCLERAIGGWQQRRPDGNARSWLFSILHNLAVSRLRRNQRQGGTHLPLDDIDETLTSHPPDQENSLRHQDLMRALHALPEDQRSVLLLVSVEDLSYAEVAKVLHIPVGTVMSRLSRGRDRLRRMLDQTAALPAPGAHLRRVK